LKPEAWRKIETRAEGETAIEQQQPPGLPDGLFSCQKIPIWVNFGGPWNGKKMLVYFMTIMNILWPFGIIYGRLL
jgi:hypothetical protein